MLNGHRVSFGWMEKMFEIVAMVAQPCEFNEYN